jgi:hypothetical protein
MLLTDFGGILEAFLSQTDGSFHYSERDVGISN